MMMYIFTVEILETITSFITELYQMQKLVKEIKSLKEENQIEKLLNLTVKK